MILRTTYLLMLMLTGLVIGTGRSPADASKRLSDKPIEPCHIEQFGAYHALADISQRAGIAIGVDAVQPDKQPTIVLEFPGGTVADLLNMFVLQVPDYRWQEEGGIIHVVRNASHISLLDVSVTLPEMRDKTREEISQEISEIPEVSAWLRSSHCVRDQFSHGKEFRTHNEPISIPSGILTVRQLLDRVAVDSGANYWAVLRSPSDPCHVSIIF